MLGDLGREPRMLGLRLLLREVFDDGRFGTVFFSHVLLLHSLSTTYRGNTVLKIGDLLNQLVKSRHNFLDNEKSGQRRHNHLAVQNRLAFVMKGN